jgi:hypothetical protein
MPDPGEPIAPVMRDGAVFVASKGGVIVHGAGRTLAVDGVVTDAI